MKMKKGTTLIELIVALVIVGIGLVAVTGFLYASWKDWYISKELKSLQEDMDLACLTIKAVCEEANYYEIQDIIEGSSPEAGRKIYVRYTDEDDNNVWEKSFYKQGSNLVMEDIKNGGQDIVIRTLDNLYFSDASNEDTEISNTIKTYIKVAKSGKAFENQFYVKVRNK